MTWVRQVSVAVSARVVTLAASERADWLPFASKAMTANVYVVLGLSPRMGWNRSPHPTVRIVVNTPPMSCCRWYPVTRTLSVASPQKTSATVVVTLLNSGVGGFDGGVASGAASVVK